MSYAIETRALTRKFNDFVAVDALNLQVETGKFFGFLGPNGAGKSTTIKMLTGLLDKTSGEARVLGFDLDENPLEAKRRIGVVPEELALFDRLNGAEYLRFVGRMYGVGAADITTRSRELLEMMELDGDPKKLVVDYSHGMKKKLALGAALIHNPRLLFLDEPFEGIDAVASRAIRELLTSLLQRGVTIFLTSHILEIVEKLCSDVAIIHEGRIVAEGTLEQLRQGVELRDETAGSRRATLEDIFLGIVDKDAGPRAELSWLG
ncbi:MAG: ABC transporter ATP-binding protein [bacterium]|nr:ABC transporter ATP-binding protein [bacterium]